MSASKFTCDDPTVSEKPKVPRYCDCADCAPSYAITDTLYAQCIGLDASDLAYAAATLLAVAASQASDDLTESQDLFEHVTAFARRYLAGVHPLSHPTKH